MELAKKLFANFDVLDSHVDPWGIVHLYLLLTKSLAEFLIARMRRNRPLDYYQVGRIKKDMRNGVFYYLCDPLRIDTSGNVFDFQHRLIAFLEVVKHKPDFTLQSMICVGFPFSGFEGVDKNKGRTIAADMKQRGTPYYSTLSTAAKYICSYLETGDFKREGTSMTTSNEAKELGLRYPELPDYASLYMSGKKILPASWLIALRCIYSMVSAEGASEFFSQVVDEKGLDDGMPAYAFKQWLTHRLPFRHANDYVTAAYTLTAMYKKFLANEKVFRCKTVLSMPELRIK